MISIIRQVPLAWHCCAARIGHTNYVERSSDQTLGDMIEEQRIGGAISDDQISQNENWKHDDESNLERGCDR